MYVSCRYAPPDATGMMPETTQGENANIICTDDQGVEWLLQENSQVGDWLRFEGTVEPAEEVIETPGGPALPERDYGAEIDALDARVTALENAL